MWSSAELYSRGAFVNGGRLLGHLFLVSSGDGGRWKDKLISALLMPHTHLFLARLMCEKETMLDYKLLHVN